MGASVGAVAAAVLVPGRGAPTARADVVDWIVDPIVEPLSAAAMAATTGLGDVGLGGVDAGSAVVLPPGLDAVLVGLVAELNSAVNGLAQGWITGPIGAAVDPVINAPFVFLVGRDLIGNGVDDFTGANTSLLGSSGMFGNLSDGGLLVGDGGTGVPGVAGVDGGDGGVGGSAGLIGEGGAGGVGVDGGTGGAGGDGGEAGTVGLVVELVGLVVRLGCSATVGLERQGWVTGGRWCWKGGRVLGWDR
ncbi:hypothetical protein [Mycobacterium botniense]|uniref:hypothetical protein n=1 Tax=Mycobacterium botniense TaxID=84962 RepID=UPI0013D07C72